MRKYSFYIFCCIISLWSVDIQAQVKFNIMGNNQFFYSSDWNEKPNHNFSFKANLEIPVSKKLNSFAIVPHFRYQKNDLSFEYISYNHSNSRSELGNYVFYQYGQFRDVRFASDKYLFGLNVQHRIINQLYLSLGYGLAYHTYKDLEGQSTSSLHYYEIDLAGYKLSSDLNAYYCINLQYKFHILPKIDIIVGSEYVHHQKIDIIDLNILGLSQYSFHLEVGAGYSF